MVERLFLYRVDTETGRPAIRRQNNLVVLPRAHKAQAALSLAQLAETRAKVALNTAIIDFVPIAARDPFHAIAGLPCFRFVHRVQMSRVLPGLAAYDMLVEQGKKTVRPPAVAGRFYPHDAEVLARTVADLMAGATSVSNGWVRAVIAPHAGYIYSGVIAAEAFASLATLKGRVERLVIIGPAHYVAFHGIAVPSVEAFDTPMGAMPLDRGAIASIAALSQVVVDDAAHAPEHALEVELPFLQTVLGTVPIIPLVVGSARAEEVAETLERLWDENTLVVVSSDLSHYHDYETARRLDTATATAIEGYDEEAIGPDAACGSLALRGMLIEAKRRGLAIERLDLRNSGDTAGDRNRVVGYGAWAVRKAEEHADCGLK